MRIWVSPPRLYFLVRGQRDGRNFARPTYDRQVRVLFFVATNLPLETHDGQVRVFFGSRT